MNECIKNIMPKRTHNKLRGKGKDKVKIGPGKDLIAAIYDPRFLKYLQARAEAKTSSREHK